MRTSNHGIDFKLGDRDIKIKNKEKIERKVKNDEFGMTRSILSAQGRERGIEVEIERPPSYSRFCISKVTQSVSCCMYILTYLR